MSNFARYKKPGTGDPLHTQEPVTVASFRTWRGWRERVARDRCLTFSILTFVKNSTPQAHPPKQSLDGPPSVHLSTAVPNVLFPSSPKSRTIQGTRAFNHRPTYCPRFSSPSHQPLL